MQHREIRSQNGERNPKASLLLNSNRHARTLKTQGTKDTISLPRRHTSTYAGQDSTHTWPSTHTMLTMHYANIFPLECEAELRRQRMGCGGVECTSRFEFTCLAYVSCTMLHVYRMQT